MSEIIYTLEEYNKLTSIMKRAYSKKQGVKVKINEDLIDINEVKNYLSNQGQVKSENTSEDMITKPIRKSLKIQKKVVINELDNQIHDSSELVVDPAIINISKECTLIKYQKVDQLQLLKGMGKVNIKEGDVLNDANGNNMLIHCVSSDLRMSQGFAVHVNDRVDPNIIRNSVKGYTLEKGDVVIIKQKNINVGYLITKGQHYSKPTNETITNTIKTLNYYLRLLPNLKIICPRIGSGLDGLNEQYVEKVLTSYLGNKVTIYDLPIEGTHSLFPKQKQFKQSKVELQKKNVPIEKVTKCFFAKSENDRLQPTSELRTGNEIIIVQNDKCDECLSKYNLFIRKFKLNNLIESDSRIINLENTDFYGFKILPKPMVNGICDTCYNQHLSQETESATIKLIFERDDRAKSISRDDNEKIVSLNITKIKDQELAFRSMSLSLIQLFSSKRYGHVNPIITDGKNYEFLKQSFPRLLKLLLLITVINVTPVSTAMLEYENEQSEEITELYIQDLADAVHDLNEEELSDVEILDEEVEDKNVTANRRIETVNQELIAQTNDEVDHPPFKNNFDLETDSSRTKREIRNDEEDGYELICENNRMIEYVMKRERMTRNYDHVYYMESARLNVGYFFNRISNTPISLNLDPNTPPMEIQAGAFIDTLALARRKDHDGLIFKWMYFYWIYISSILVEKNMDQKIRVVYLPKLNQIQVVYDN